MKLALLVPIEGHGAAPASEAAGADRETADEDGPVQPLNPEAMTGAPGPYAGDRNGAMLFLRATID